MHHAIYLKDNYIARGIISMDLKYDHIDNMGHRISVDIGTPVKLEVKDIELPLQSSIVGLESDRYIIIKAPEPFKRIQHKLYNGNELIVRYISNGTVYAFQTKMMETITSPLPLLFINYPQIIQHHELRHQKRVNCQIPTRIQAHEQENIGCIVDMAASGCRCVIQTKKNTPIIRFDLEDHLTLRCIFPGSKELISLPGVVKNVKRTTQEYDLGISFGDDISMENQKLLAWYVATLERYN